MILWLALFLLIVAVSFLLAYQSMKDYQEKPGSIRADNSLFLVKNPSGLTKEILDELHQILSADQGIIALEKLFKGSQKALVIYASKSLLSQFSSLKIVELEDYVNIEGSKFYAWEAVSKDPLSLHTDLPNIGRYVPPLQSSEQVWLQFSLQPSPKSLWSELNQSRYGRTYESIALNKAVNANPHMKDMITQQNRQKVFQAHLRFVILASPDRQRQIAESLENIEGKLIKIPRPFTSDQLLVAYKQRAKSTHGEDLLFLTSDEIISLL